MQARIGASRLEYKLKRNCPDKTKLRVIEKAVCEVSRFAAKIPQTLFVKNLDAICPASLRPAANQSGCKRAEKCKVVIAANGSGLVQ